MSKIKKIIYILLVCVFVFSFSLINVNAADTLIMTNPYTKPQLTGDNGYIELLYQNADGTLSSALFMWDCLDSSDSETLVNVTINEHSILLSPSFSSGSGVFTVSYIDSSGYKEFYNQLYFSGLTYTKNSGATFIAVHVYGNYNIVNYNIPNPPITNFEVVYGGNIQLVTDVNSILNKLESNNVEIIQAQKDNANQIQQNQNENTDKIIDNQNQLQQNEKNEAETKGQESIDNVSGAIDDKSTGFISSITSLVASMSYEGTACAWSFPALKLPAIEGVMPEYQLTEEKPIDFEFWVNKIPSNILLLVRSLLTVALIAYCFKELYSTISYVLTLKGGANNE